jgi:hypothetical protein
MHPMNEAEQARETGREGPLARDAAGVCAGLGLDEAAAALLRAGMDVETCLSVLEQAGQVLPAILVLSRCLPPHVAIDWAFRCRSAVPAAADAAEALCLEAAQSWLIRPDEDQRRAAQRAAEAGGYKTAGAWIAAAVAWSGGSLAPDGQPPVSPPPELCARAVAGAIGLSAAQSTAPPVLDCQRRFLQLGLDIVRDTSARSPRP